MILLNLKLTILLCFFASAAISQTIYLDSTLKEVQQQNAVFKGTRERDLGLYKITASNIKRETIERIEYFRDSNLTIREGSWEFYDDSGRLIRIVCFHNNEEDGSWLELAGI